MELMPPSWMLPRVKDCRCAENHMAGRDLRDVPHPLQKSMLRFPK